MGQICNGLIYGMEQPEEITEDIIEDYYRYLKQSGKDPRKFSIYASNVDKAWIGFFIAIGGSGEDDIPYLDDFELSEVKEVYKESLAEAKLKWSMFTKWFTKKLPKPKIYLIQCETA